MAIPPIIFGRDTIVRAPQTGCGTTTALLLAALSRVDSMLLNTTQAVMLFRCRELVYHAMQLVAELVKPISQQLQQQQQRNEEEEAQNSAENGMD